MSLFDSISDFFSLLFSKDPAGSRGKRELREVRAFLKSQKPALYKPSGQILPSYAQAHFELVNALRPINDLLSRTILLADARIARRFWDYLVERRLAETERKMVSSCTYESLKSRLAAGGMPDTELAVSESNYRLAMKSLDGADLAEADKELQELERMADLCRYDHYRILSFFDPGCNSDSTVYKPKFKAVDGPSLSTNLADFYSVAADLRFGPSVTADLSALADRIGGEGAEDYKKRCTKALAQINKILASICSAQTLCALLKVIREEPSYKPPSPVIPPSQVGIYRERFTRRWREDADRIQRELKEDSLNQDVVALFGTPPQGGLIPVNAYNDELNKRLQEEASFSLAWVMPFRILKSFDRRFLTQDFVEAAKRLVVEGFFNNTLLRSQLTDSISKVEKSFARVSAFEESAGGQGRVSAAALRRALDESAKGKNVLEPIERIASALDLRAKEIVEQDIRTMRELAELLYDIINDFKKPTPDMISNLKTMAASKDKSLIPTLLTGYNAIARLLKIMKIYLVVTPIQGVGVGIGEEL